MSKSKKKNKGWKTGDHVWVRSLAGEGIPDVQVELLSREVREPQKGNTIDWPGYVTWNARLIKKSEVEMLKKRWSIPYSWPSDLDLIVFESNILKKV